MGRAVAVWLACTTLACGRSDLSVSGPARAAGPLVPSGRDAALAPDLAPVADAARVVVADVAGPMIRLDVAQDPRLARCGNGHVDPGEECDDGNPLAGDGCNTSCQIECYWETCPDVPNGTTVVCGDGVLRAPEGCDDANLSAGDGCSPSCTVERGFHCPVPGRRCVPVCGDGLTIAPEACDDGNITAGDGCSPYCLVEPCWDCTGACRPQPMLDGGTCTRAPSGWCGNGRIDGAEECDDGVANSDDTLGGCSTRCQYLHCGDGLVSAPEECDDGAAGNTAVYGNRTGCTARCARPHYCGDGFIDEAFGEQCDDGVYNSVYSCMQNCIVWLP